MTDVRFEKQMDPFSEYAFLVEDDDYPKNEVSMIQLKGKVDEGAMALAYREAMKKMPVFSSHLEERHIGMSYVPVWVFDPEVENRLVVEDCRHMIEGEYDISLFCERYFAPFMRRCLDLKREFPFYCFLLRVQDDTYIFAIVFHHSALDPVKVFTVLNEMLGRYHEAIKGQWPEWASAGSHGAEMRKKTGVMIKPLSLTQFAKEQLSDVWIKNRKGMINPLATSKIEDYRKVKGRYSFLKIIDDTALIQAMVDRAISAGCTLNDLIMAVCRKTFSEWNIEHDQPHDRFRMMITTSLHGRMQLPKDSGAGLAGINMVSAGHGNADLDTVMQFFRDQRNHQLKRGVDIRFFTTLNSIVKAMRLLPLKTRTRLIRPIVAGIPVTLNLSNLGSVWPKEIFPDGRQSLDSRITEVGDFRIELFHSSISIARNLDTLITMRTHNRRLTLSMVFDRFRFRREEGAKLSGRLYDNLENAL